MFFIRFILNQYKIWIFKLKTTLDNPSNLVSHCPNIVYTYVFLSYPNSSPLGLVESQAK